jgi:hypothetical protein
MTSTNKLTKSLLWDVNPDGAIFDARFDYVVLHKRSSRHLPWSPHMDALHMHRSNAG